MLTRSEVECLLPGLRGATLIMGALLYGSALRLIECLRLRVKDLDFTRHEILVREGKGGKDRVTMLPRTVEPPLASHLERVASPSPSEHTPCATASPPIYWRAGTTSASSRICSAITTSPRP